MIDGRISYGTATVLGIIEDNEDVWTIKLDNIDADGKEPVSEIELEPLQRLYTENISNKSKCNREVVDDRKLGGYWTPKGGDKRSRKSTEFLHSPTKIDDGTDNITPPNLDDATTCTMFFHDNEEYLFG